VVQLFSQVSYALKLFEHLLFVLILIFFLLIHPFSRVGIDFTGPLVMTDHRLRKARQFMVYIAVFVCFTVKAVHLEYVSDLTTDAFLAALQRFVARRGVPNDIYTDCGTNFVGASNQLRELVNAPGSKDGYISRFHCTWHFNPLGAPHFGYYGKRPCVPLNIYWSV